MRQSTDRSGFTYLPSSGTLQDGIAPGGLNFDAKVRRESIDLKDLFVAHAAAMDTFARGLKNAAKIISEGVFTKSINVSYFIRLFCSGGGRARHIIPSFDGQ